MAIKVNETKCPPIRTCQKGFTLVEMMVAMVASSIVLIGIAVIVAGSHKYINDGRSKLRLQQDFSLIETVLVNYIPAGNYNQQEIYATYADYTGSGSAQASGECLKLYFPAGDSVVIYKENSDFKIQKADLSITNLVPTVVDSILFSEGTKSIQTYVGLAQNGKTMTSTLLHAFRNVSASADSVADDFDDGGSTTGYTGSDGSQAWSTDWIEVGDDAAYLTGNIFVETHAKMPTTAYHLKLQVKEGAIGKYVYRDGDLTSATAATLTYIYRDEIRSGGRVDFEISTNGGSSWTTLKTYNSDSDTVLNETLDLTPYVGNMVRIRFIVVSWGSRHLRIDSVRIAY